MNEDISKRHPSGVEVSNKLKAAEIELGLTSRLAYPELSDDLPVDKERGGGPRTVLGAGLSIVDLYPPQHAQVLSFSEEVAQWFKGFSRFERMDGSTRTDFVSR